LGFNLEQKFLCSVEKLGDYRGLDDIDAALDEFFPFSLSSSLHLPFLENSTRNSEHNEGMKQDSQHL
jgi:hypothetical protein